MSIADSLADVTRLFIDTAPVIYYVEQNPNYFPVASVVFNKILQGKPIGVTSPITLSECLILPYRLGARQLQQDFIELITNTENLEFLPIDKNIAQQASELRATYNFLLPDAYQLAVALAAECEAFLTNDVIFKRVTELQVLVLDDFREA